MGVAEIWRLDPKILRSLRDNNNKVKGRDRVLVKIKVREGANSSNSKQHNNRIWVHQDRCPYLQFLLNNNNSRANSPNMWYAQPFLNMGEIIPRFDRTLKIQGYPKAPEVRMLYTVS